MRHISLTKPAYVYTNATRIQTAVIGGANPLDESTNKGLWENVEDERRMVMETVAMSLFDLNYLYATMNESLSNHISRTTTKPCVYILFGCLSLTDALVIHRQK